MALRADDVDLTRDSNLVVRFQSGDQAAFDDLYRRYFARLHRYCLRRVGDPHEAEEIAQEAFARALRAMPAFAGERRFYPWMTVIAGRLCVDAHRRRGRATPVADIDPGSVEADLTEVFEAVDHEHLALAMERLAPRHREVLELREREGWSYQRIADSYAVSLGTVEALLHRARRALRREYLQVAGDTPRWALVPGLGWVGRKVVAMRARLGDHPFGWAEAASPLAVKAASVAIASIAVAGVTAGAGRVTHQTAGRAATVNAPLTVRMDVGPAVDAVAAIRGAASAVASDRVVVDHEAVHGFRGVTRPTTSDGSTVTNDQPIVVGTSDVGVGVNVEGLYNDILGTSTVPVPPIPTTGQGTSISVPGR